MKKFDFIIRNGQVYDGKSIHKDFDVAIEKEKIANIGNIKKEGKQEIDAEGMIVSPGFIDAHTHVTTEEMLNKDGGNFLCQGVTTVVTGNCGDIGDVSSKGEVLEFINRMKKSNPPINVATLVGHNSIREFVLEGNSNRPANTKEINKMAEIVDSALSEGAIGFSTGLMYDPGRFAEEREIYEILKRVVDREKIYTTHIRNEGKELEAAVEEALRAAKKTGVNLQISHHKAVGKENWGKVKNTVSKIKKAREENNVTVDVYPYTATSTVMRILLPKSISKEVDNLEELKISQKYIKIQDENGLQNMCNNSWKDVLVTKHSNSEYEGRSIQNLSEGNPTKKYLEIIKEDPKSKGIFQHISSQNDLEFVIKQPFSMIVSDGHLYDSREKPRTHPRSFGATTKFLKEFIREGDLGLKEGLSKITSLPGRIFSLHGRGYLRPGCFADLAIFKLENIQNKETYKKPYSLAEGMEYVFCNGEIVLENGEVIGGNGTFVT